MSITLGERVAVVEEKIDNMAEAGDRREEKQDEILSKLSSIENEMSRYRGFFGGIMLVVSGVGILVSKLSTPIWMWIRSHT